MTDTASSKTQLNAALAAFFASRPMGRIGVAVSGGGDSMALLRGLVDFAKPAGITVCAATVDHGLREAAKAEAETVAATAKALDVPHDTLLWDGWTGEGNLLSEARAARYRLLAEWAKENRLDAVAIGHTSDDIAETFMMRLARGAGLAGLAAMSGDWRENDMRFLRPVLTLSRSDLRDCLSDLGQGWIDDPTNDDDTFDRVRMRNALPDLAELGLTRERMSDVARQLADANAALQSVAQGFAQQHCREHVGDVLIDRSAFVDAPDDIKRRILNGALCYVASAHYVPRGTAMTDLMRAIATGKGHTLHGCQITQTKGMIRVGREYNAVRDAIDVDRVWDGRWRIFDDIPTTYVIRALGEDGLAQIENWRDCGVPRRTLIASPSIWENGRLVAAPHAQFGDNFEIGMAKSDHSFIGSMITH